MRQKGTVPICLSRAAVPGLRPSLTQHDSYHTGFVRGTLPEWYDLWDPFPRFWRPKPYQTLQTGLAEGDWYGSCGSGVGGHRIVPLYHGRVTRTFAADVVFFDLDDTLFDHRTSAHRAIARWAPGLGADAASACARWDAVETEYFTRYERGELSMSEQRVARIRGFLGQPDMPADKALRLFDEFLAVYETYWEPFPDAVSAVLRCQRAGVRVGVVTNGHTDQQRRKIARIGVPVEPSALFISEAVGVRKPDPAMFVLACQAMDVDPAAALMVGDNPVNDVDAARAAGLQAVRLDRAGTTPGALRTLDDLVATPRRPGVAMRV